MLAIRDIYNSYIKSINHRLERAYTLLKGFNSSIEYMREQIKTCDTILNNNGYSVTTMIGTTFYKENTYASIQQLQLAGDPVAIKNVLFYMGQLHLLYKRQSNITVYINKTKLELVSYTLFNKTLAAYNESISHQVLNGGIIPLGNKMGTLSILRKERVTYLDPSVGIVTRNINWRESNLYKDQLIAEGKQPYNAATTPDGIKWFIYHDEPHTYWFTWKPCKNLQNRAVTKFLPTNFINTTTRSHKDFIINCTKPQEIIYSTLLGNRDKLQTLVKYDKIFAQKYEQLNLN